jgi:hypothetical protein
MTINYFDFFFMFSYIYVNIKFQWREFWGIGIWGLFYMVTLDNLRFNFFSYFGYNVLFEVDFIWWFKRFASYYPSSLLLCFIVFVIKKKVYCCALESLLLLMNREAMTSEIRLRKHLRKHLVLWKNVGGVVCLSLLS